MEIGSLASIRAVRRPNGNAFTPLHDIVAV